MGGEVDESVTELAWLTDWTASPPLDTAECNPQIELANQNCSVSAPWSDEAPSWPGSLETEAAPLHVLPVTHAHRLGSCRGTLRLFDGHLEYDSVDRDLDDRVWVYADLSDLSFDSGGKLGFTFDSRNEPAADSRRRFNFQVEEDYPPLQAFDHLARLIGSGPETDGAVE